MNTLPVQSQNFRRPAGSELQQEPFHPDSRYISIVYFNSGQPKDKSVWSINWTPQGECSPLSREGLQRSGPVLKEAKISIVVLDFVISIYRVIF